MAVPTPPFIVVFLRKMTIRRDPIFRLQEGGGYNHGDGPGDLPKRYLFEGVGTTMETASKSRKRGPFLELWRSGGYNDGDLRPRSGSGETLSQLYVCIW